MDKFQDVENSEKEKPIEVADSVVNNGNKGKPLNIILCSDGTGMKGGDGFETNVWRIYNYIDFQGHLRNKKLCNQIAFHDDGIGTQSFKPLRALTGATGLGLSKNIKRLYTDLVNNYNENDRIYLFGFSRGAFTVRSLAGLISKFGILKVSNKNYRAKDITRAIDVTYHRHKAAHRKKLFIRGKNYGVITKSILIVPDLIVTGWWHIHDWVYETVWGNEYEYFMSKNEKGEDDGGPPINTIGVWDTVGAIGAPVKFIKNLMEFWGRIDFNDAGLHKNVLRGYHALSIDDKRQSFHPLLWKENDKDDDRITQIWFTGVHTNVGGGYAKDGLAFASLRWMLEEIKEDNKTSPKHFGLRFVEGTSKDIAAKSNPHDFLYNSRKGFGSYYRFEPRNIKKYAEDYCQGKVPKIHCTTFERIGCHTQRYAPDNIPMDVKIVSTKGDKLAINEKTLSTNLKKHYSLAENIKEIADGNKWIRPRQSAYKLTLLYSFLFIGLVFLVPDNKITMINQPLELILNTVKLYPESFWALIFGISTSFLIRLWCRSESAKSFGDFWWKADKILPKG
jgi:uncharacterized protein (DUF2235 family)